LEYRGIEKTLETSFYLEKISSWNYWT